MIGIVIGLTISTMLVAFGAEKWNWALLAVWLVAYLFLMTKPIVIAAVLSWGAWKDIPEAHLLKIFSLMDKNVSLKDVFPDLKTARHAKATFTALGDYLKSAIQDPLLVIGAAITVNAMGWTKGNPWAVIPLVLILTFLGILCIRHFAGHWWYRHSLLGIFVVALLLVLFDMGQGLYYQYHVGEGAVAGVKAKLEADRQQFTANVANAVVKKLTPKDYASDDILLAHYNGQGGVEYANASAVQAASGLIIDEENHGLKNTVKDVVGLEREVNHTITSLQPFKVCGFEPLGMYRFRVGRDAMISVILSPGTPNEEVVRYSLLGGGLSTTEKLPYADNLRGWAVVLDGFISGGTPRADGNGCFAGELNIPKSFVANKLFSLMGERTTIPLRFKKL